MAENNEKPTISAKSKAVKKRTIYAPKGILDLPDWAKKDTEHKYRWVSKRRLARSDGFDPRGWAAAKDPQGNGLEAHDTILSKMPNEEFEAMKDYKDNLAHDSLKHALEGIEGASDRLRYEVEKLGGKISNSDFTIERKA